MNTKLSTTLVAVSLDDGSLSILSFLTVGRGTTLPYGAQWIEPGVWQREPNDTNVFHEISRAFPFMSDTGSTLPKPTGYRVVTTLEVPQDRTYRDAWMHDGVTIIHHMGKAKEIHRNILRAERAPLLADLDVQYQKADEKNDAAEKMDIAKRKQELRDITKLPSIEAATTIEDLKKIRL